MGSISNPVIFDISSDEEGDDVWKEPSDEHRDWLSELLDDTPDNANDDSDEVVIVGEVSGSCKRKETGKPAFVGDDSDDDCLILEGDPDDHVSAVNDTGNGSDELLVVGEKGQLACRDYPHPRHLCVTFPFSTSAHGKYCTLCHCYVCDSPAPCAYWGTGFSSTDHCHSTDKEVRWKALRKCFKQGQTIPGPMQNKSEAIPSMGRPLHKSVPMPSHSQPLNCGPIPVHSVPKATIIRACPPVPSFGVPNNFCQKIPHLGPPMCKIPTPQRVNSNSRSQPMMGTHSVVRRDKITSTTGSHSVNAHVNFKRAGSTGTAALRKNRYGHVSSNSGNQGYIPQPQRMPPVAHYGESYNNKHQDYFGPMNSGVNTCQSSQSSTYTDLPRNTFPPAAPVYCPQQNESQIMYPNPNPPGFNYGWMSYPPQNIVTEHYQHPSIQPSTEPLPVADTVSSCPGTGSTNPSLPDFHLERWINALENQVGVGDANHTVPSAVDYVPSQTDMLDEGNLFFDFENDLLQNV